MQIIIFGQDRKVGQEKEDRRQENLALRYFFRIAVYRGLRGAKGYKINLGNKRFLAKNRSIINMSKVTCPNKNAADLHFTVSEIL